MEKFCIHVHASVGVLPSKVYFTVTWSQGSSWGWNIAGQEDKHCSGLLHLDWFTPCTGSAIIDCALSSSYQRGVVHAEKRQKNNKTASSKIHKGNDTSCILSKYSPGTAERETQRPQWPLSCVQPYSPGSQSFHESLHCWFGKSGFVFEVIIWLRLLPQRVIPPSM